jgi:hypothetical protein
METALLGQFQPQTQQTGFASRKYSPLVNQGAAFVVVFHSLVAAPFNSDLCYLPLVFGFVLLHH